MSLDTSSAGAFDRALSRIPACALTEHGVREQRARYARLEPHITRVEDEPRAVVIDYDESFDRATLEEALAAERECCPFFQFHFDEDARRLRITVSDPAQVEALGALAEALGAAE